MDRRVTHSRPETRRDPDALGRGLWASIGLHVVLGTLLIASPWLFPAYGDDQWGDEGGGMGGISVDIVSDFGVPLPTPANARPDAVGNDSPGLYAPAPPPEPPPAPETEAEAELVPEVFEVREAAAEEAEPDPEPEPAPPPSPPAPRPEPAAPPAPVPTPAAPPRDEPAPAPANAIPFGEGGRPDVSGGFPIGGQGTGNLEFGDGAFGNQYGTYVRAMRQRISENWLQSMVNASVPAGRRVTLTFDILRSGQIDTLRIAESSGDPSLDQSAERAIQRSNPLAALPTSYGGPRVSVRFWFEYVR